MSDNMVYVVAHHDYDADWVDSVWTTRPKAEARLEELFKITKKRTEEYYGKREAKSRNFCFHYDIDEYPLDKVEEE